MGPIPARPLLVLFATVFLIMLGFGIIIPVLPFFARDLGASAVQLGLMVSVWAGAQLLCAPLWGSFSDRAGRKPALLLGLGGFGVSFLLMGLANSVNTLLLARALGGVISAAVLPAANAYVADITAPGDRGQAMALLGAAFATGFTCGPAAGGLLAPLGVTVPFFVAGALGLAAVPLAMVLLPETAGRGGAAGRPPGWRAVRGALRGPESLFYWLAFANTFAGSAMFTMLAYYLMDRFGGGSGEAGVVFTLHGVIIVIAQGLVVGRAIRARGEPAVLLGGLGVAALGYLAIALAPGYASFLAAVVLASAGMALVKPPLLSGLSRSTVLPQGAAMGVLTAFDSAGRMLGPLWAGWAFGLAVTGPYYSAAAVMVAGLALVRLFPAALSGKIQPAVTYNP